MSKKYYHDKLDIKHYEIRVHHPDLTPEKVEELLIKYVKGSNACLTQFVQDGHFEEFARMYARNWKSVTARTSQARKLYSDNLNLDILKGRIQAVLPGAAQRIVIADYIATHPNEDDAFVARSLYELIVNQKSWQVKAPNAQIVGNVRRQMLKSADGVLRLPAIEPDFGDRFAFSDSDAVMSTVRRHGKQIVFKSGYQGKAYEIVCDVPDKRRYQVGKVCKPDVTVYVDEDGRERVMLSFSIKHSAPVQYDPLCSLGVDVGEVYPFICAVTGTSWHSQGIYPRKEILDIVDKMNDLSFQISVLTLKIRQDEPECRRNTLGVSLAGRVDCLRVERERLVAKRSCLKKEVAHQVAHRVCELALACRAQIVLEKLNWSDPKHAFYHSLLHDAIRNRCLSLGVPVIVVSARDSSARSPVNGSKLVQGVVHGCAASGARKCRSSWRSVDVSSGVRDGSLRRSVADKSGVSVEHVSYDEVVREHEGRRVRRGVRDRVRGCVCDHDLVAPLNLGVRGEAVRRGVKGAGVLRARLSGFCFVRLRFGKGCRGELALTAPGSVMPSGIASGFFSLVGPYQASLAWSTQQRSPVPLLDPKTPAKKQETKEK